MFLPNIILIGLFSWESYHRVTLLLRHSVDGPNSYDTKNTAYNTVNNAVSSTALYNS